jgi:hypothetical protein
MSDTSGSADKPRPLRGTPDLPLIIEHLQNQLDDLAVIVRAQQNQLAQQAARIAALERS